MMVMMDGVEVVDGTVVCWYDPGTERWLGDGSGDREVMPKTWTVKSLTRDVDY